VSDADDAGRRAVALLEQLPPTRELAMAFGNLAQLRMNAEDADATVTSGTRSLELGSGSATTRSEPTL
jgi:hypothetical protein